MSTFKTSCTVWRCLYIFTFKPIRGVIHWLVWMCVVLAVTVCQLFWRTSWWKLIAHRGLERDWRVPVLFPLFLSLSLILSLISSLSPLATASFVVNWSMNRKGAKWRYVVIVLNFSLSLLTLYTLMFAEYVCLILITYSYTGISKNLVPLAFKPTVLVVSDQHGWGGDGCTLVCPWTAFSMLAQVAIRCLWLEGVM